MSENQKWITIEQAAVALGLSVRTVNRHINAGKIESRLNDGRREVVIDDAHACAATGGTSLVINDHPSSGADDGIDFETILALADNAADKAELAVSAYQTLARSADERIQSTRRSSHAAWSLVGALALCTIVAVGWTTRTLTKAAVETEHLQRQLGSATAMADTNDHECDDLRRALAEAREQAARNEGKLAAYSESRQTTPTTRPTLADRIATIFDQ